MQGVEYPVVGPQGPQGIDNSSNSAFDGKIGYQGPRGNFLRDAEQGPEGGPGPQGPFGLSPQGADGSEPQTKEFLEDLKGSQDHKDKQNCTRNTSAHLGLKVLRVQVDFKDQQRDPQGLDGGFTDQGISGPKERQEKEYKDPQGLPGSFDALGNRVSRWNTRKTWIGLEIEVQMDLHLCRVCKVPKDHPVHQYFRD